MLQRLVHKADFESLLAARTWSRSAHFALHHVAGVPAAPKKPSKAVQTEKISTGSLDLSHEAVDKSGPQHWLACVAPKRHAKRAVTRSLMKRQMRSVFSAQLSQLPAGLWLLRLRQGFAVAQYPSAASAALTAAVRDELTALLMPPANHKAGFGRERVILPTVETPKTTAPVGPS